MQPVLGPGPIASSLLEQNVYYSDPGNTQLELPALGNRRVPSANGPGGRTLRLVTVSVWDEVSRDAAVARGAQRRAKAKEWRASACAYLFISSSPASRSMTR